MTHEHYSAIRLACDILYGGQNRLITHRLRDARIRRRFGGKSDGISAPAIERCGMASVSASAWQVDGTGHVASRLEASDNIALSQMLNGIRTQDGRQLDSGVGLTKKTLLQAIRSLEAQNIIVRITGGQLASFLVRVMFEHFLAVCGGVRRSDVDNMQVTYERF